MNYFYKKAGVILARSSKWDIEQYGFAKDGIGDCIFRTAIASMAYNDHSLVNKCKELLQDRIRWPNLLDPPKIKGKESIRSQRSMTRDPYIMTYCAMYFLTEGPTLNLHGIRMPWWLYRSYLSNWKKFLVAACDPNCSRKEFNKYRPRFERQLARLVWWGNKTEPIRINVEKSKFLRWTRHVFGIHAYSLHLWVWMAYTAGSTKAMDILWPYVPKWNHLLCAMIFGPPTHEPYVSDVEDYKSKKGYQWTGHVWKDKDYLPEGEKYYLDKDILNFIIDRKS